MSSSLNELHFHVSLFRVPLKKVRDFTGPLTSSGEKNQCKSIGTYSDWSLLSCTERLLPWWSSFFDADPDHRARELDEYLHVKIKEIIYVIKSNLFDFNPMTQLCESVDWHASSPPSSKQQLKEYLTRAPCRDHPVQFSGPETGGIYTSLISNTLQIHFSYCFFFFFLSFAWLASVFLGYAPNILRESEHMKVWLSDFFGVHASQEKTEKTHKIETATSTAQAKLTFYTRLAQLAWIDTLVKMEALLACLTLMSQNALETCLLRIGLNGAGGWHNTVSEW